MKTFVCQIKNMIYTLKNSEERSKLQLFVACYLHPHMLNNIELYWPFLPWLWVKKAFALEAWIYTGSIHASFVFLDRVTDEGAGMVPVYCPVLLRWPVPGTSGTSITWCIQWIYCQSFINSNKKTYENKRHASRLRPEHPESYDLLT